MNFILFSKCEYLILTQYLKYALKVYLENEKNGDFTLLNKSLEP